MSVAVVIPSKNSAKTIERCVISLMRYFERGFIAEIVVVDAHSNDGTVEKIRKYPLKILFDRGKGMDAANDIGWRSTNSEFVVFLDSDAYIGDNFFPAVFQYFNNRRIGVLGCAVRAVVTNVLTKTVDEWCIYRIERLTRLLGHSIPLSMLSPVERHLNSKSKVLTSGPCYIVRRSCLNAVGGFHNPFADDSGLCSRIVKAGSEATWWTDAPVYHFYPDNLKDSMNVVYSTGWQSSLIHYNNWTLFQKFLHLGGFAIISPIYGLLMTFKFRNPIHFALHPLLQAVALFGYHKGVKKRLTL